jgi:hypothetical protein
MARLSGSFPLKFNDRVIGKAYIVGQDETGIVVDVRFNNPELLDSIMELVRLNDLPSMSFGFVADLPEPKGLMQVMKPDPLDLAAYRKVWDEMSEEDKLAATQRYMQERLNKRD